MLRHSYCWCTMHNISAFWQERTWHRNSPDWFLKNFTENLFAQTSMNMIKSALKLSRLISFVQLSWRNTASALIIDGPALAQPKAVIHVPFPPTEKNMLELVRMTLFPFVCMEMSLKSWTSAVFNYPNGRPSLHVAINHVCFATVNACTGGKLDS